MGLVADVLQEPQGVRPPGEATGLVFAGDVDLFFLLGQRDGEWRRDAERPHRLQGRVELAFAAVDEQQVRERLALVLQPCQPAGDDLGDRGEIVYARDGPDAEPLVAVLEGQAVDELHQAGDRLAAREVRDVDPLRSVGGAPGA